ncbi:hypothetical protein ElyMa_000119400 [Elysia marginata]|uniref:Uncharacterized protein n=1 Tax=Elysia marginata TaxID=1093978 RepID=A0AAV4ELX7_9GAST|nr:hypothetical protein ElyMa_000119400 [Elysia marginata]
MLFYTNVVSINMYAVGLIFEDTEPATDPGCAKITVVVTAALSWMAGEVIDNLACQWQQCCCLVVALQQPYQRYVLQDTLAKVSHLKLQGFDKAIFR